METRHAAGTGVPEGVGVRSLLLVIVGALLDATGLIWTLQGLGVIGGSFMSGNRTWAVIGPLVCVAGTVLIVYGARRGRSRGAS